MKFDSFTVIYSYIPFLKTHQNWDWICHKVCTLSSKAYYSYNNLNLYSDILALCNQHDDNKLQFKAWESVQIIKLLNITKQ